MKLDIFLISFIIVSWSLGEWLLFLIRKKVARRMSENEALTKFNEFLSKRGIYRRPIRYRTEDKVINTLVLYYNILFAVFVFTLVYYVIYKAYDFG